MRYSFSDIAAGTYTLKVPKYSYDIREHTITMGMEAVTQDAKIHRQMRYQRRQ